MRHFTKCGRFIQQTHSRTLILITRSLATIPPGRPQTTFTENLNSGPALTDFLTSTDPTSVPGSSRLPDWLKRPIPAGGNFSKIKKDLRGLNLHTGILLLRWVFNDSM